MFVIRERLYADPVVLIKISFSQNTTIYQSYYQLKHKRIVFKEVLKFTLKFSCASVGNKNL